MNLFESKKFISHSGETLDFKIECDILSKNDIECIASFISKHTAFSVVFGIPTGGVRLKMALDEYVSENTNTILIVDDVLTTGKSMNIIKKSVHNKFQSYKIVGWVIFSRINPPDWINAMFTLYQS